MPDIKERDFILIGLGAFGKKTIDLFNDFFIERKHQIDSEVLKKTNVYTTSFDTAQDFNYTNLSKNIDDLVKDSKAKKFNNRFSYIFIGDLYDLGTSTYLIDYAYLPWAIEQAGSLKKKEVLGFFTFADAYGATVKADNSAMASIYRYFDNIYNIDVKNKYVVPYKDPDGHNFGDISSPNGPFDRNYLNITPGSQDAVDRDTSQIYAERIFYEIFYLASIFDKSINHISDAPNGKLFSSFSMIQISRLEDLQHYFLKYTREDQISDYLLADFIKGIDLDYYQNKFFQLIDIPDSDEFPIDRAADLFIDENKSSISHLLDIYQSKQNSDFKDYVNTCKNRISEKLEELTPKYTEFTRVQIDHMLETFEYGYQQLFNINRLTGNINTYILYIEKLADRLNYWETSFKNIISEETDFSMDKYYDEAEKQIKKIQKNFIYKIPFFVPIRRKLIENVILGLPLEEYLRKIIKKNIAQSFLDQWEDKSASSRNPVSDCEELIAALKRMKELMQNKKVQIKNKINFITEIPSYYYVISEKEQDEYKELLAQIKSEYFGTAKKSSLESQAKEFFKTWTEGKTRQKITNSSEFIKHFDEFIESKTVSDMEGYSLRSSAEDFKKFAEDAVYSMDIRTEQLSTKSFRSDSNALSSKKFLLNPKRQLDQLSEKLKDKMSENSEIENLTVPREFTLGSVVYFQDFLGMSREECQKFENLAKYKDEKVPEPKYINEAKFDTDNVTSIKKEEKETLSSEFTLGSTNPSIEDSMTFRNQCVRSILLDFCDSWVLNSWYKAKFNEEVESVTDEQVIKLSKSIELEEILETLDDSTLHDFAKDIDAPVSPVKDRQIGLIISTIKRQEACC